jgi:hypothetical protein
MFDDFDGSRRLVTLTINWPAHRGTSRAMIVKLLDVVAPLESATLRAPAPPGLAPALLGVT